MLPHSVYLLGMSFAQIPPPPFMQFIWLQAAAELGRLCNEGSISYASATVDVTKWVVYTVFSSVLDFL